MDKETFAKKLMQLEFDAASFEHQKDTCQNTVAKYDSYVQKTVVEELDLFIHASYAMQYILNNDELYTYTDGIIDNFVTDNIDILQEEESLIRFKSYIAGNAEIRFLSKFFLSEEFTPYKPPKRIKDFFSTPKATQALEYKTIPGKEFTRKIDSQMNVINSLLVEKTAVPQRALWIICYYFVLLSMVERLSLQWSNTYPQFESIDSKSLALEAYMRIENQVAGNFPFICWLFYKGICPQKLYEISQSIRDEIKIAKKDFETAEIKRKLLQPKTDVITQPFQYSDRRMPITIEIIDKYSGAEFEAFVGSLFEADGYKVEFTQASNDKGIDIIAKTNGIGIGIQCKRYSNTVGISSVQEVFSGKNFYSLDKALVVTNNSFTKAAIDLAKSTGVVLWDRHVLVAKISIL